MKYSELLSCARSIGRSTASYPSRVAAAHVQRVVRSLLEMWEWQSIETAPRDGTHILACDATVAYDEHWTFNQRPPTVVHWWSNPGEEGFYTSVNELEPQEPFRATHWKPLGPAPQ